MKPPAQPPTPAFLNALSRHLLPNTDFVPLDQYIQCALYDPDAGYYTASRDRVGRSDKADFYTASSLGPVFARLVVGAVETLLPDNPGQYTFVELGPETDSGLLGHLDAHPFREHRQFRPGSKITLSGKTVVFANEVLDAQPFQRFMYKDGSWKEAVIRLRDDSLSWDWMDPLHTLPTLPQSVPDGYTIDWPSGAHKLLDTLCNDEWSGLLLTFDYGLDRQTIFKERPEGTGRTYARHVLGNDLLDGPGTKDITCHLIWDELEDILSRRHFRNIGLDRQEAFLIKRAAAVFEAILQEASPGLSPVRQTLMELIHPDNMGHKFQVLHALRGEF